ncbi:MAG: hypothetical protein E7672_00825 [Ruminococcaceae bacterium]|nr:hypothetical protein [Oscillospiraceae bacterium]
MNGILKNTLVRMSLVVMIVLFAVVFITLRLQSNDLRAKADELQARIDDMNEYINELNADLDRPFDDEYVAEIAQDKLGLRFPQEVIFYSGDGN